MKGKNGLCQGNLTWVIYFQPCLCLSLQHRYMRKEQIADSENELSNLLSKIKWDT